MADRLDRTDTKPSVVETESGRAPRSDLDASLTELGRALASSPAAQLSEQELIAAADRAKHEVRAERRKGEKD